DEAQPRRLVQELEDERRIALLQLVQAEPRSLVHTHVRHGTRARAGSTRSQRLPYRSTNTATVPYGSTRGSSTKRTPRARNAAWSRAKSSVCRNRNTRPPVWSPTRAACRSPAARASSSAEPRPPGGA